MRLEYFQMVDRITSLDLASGRIVAECEVPDASPVFEGHFPGHPILPGVLMIETMAQAGGWLVLAAHRFGRMAFLMQVEKAKIRSAVAPATRLTSEAALVHDGSGYAVIRGSLAAAGRKVAEAEIRYGVAAFPNDTLKAAMLDAARRLAIPEDLLAPASQDSPPRPAATFLARTGSWLAGGWSPWAVPQRIRFPHGA